jgi:hypothetical protein
MTAEVKDTWICPFSTAGPKPVAGPPAISARGSVCWSKDRRTVASWCVHTSYED